MKKIVKIFVDCYTKKLFKARGRSNRTEYILCAAIFPLSFGYLGELINNHIITRALIDAYPYLLIPSFGMVIIMVILVLQMIFITIRRLHDINFRGWWYIPMLLIPLGQLIFIILCFIKSTPGPNRYGEPTEY